MTTASLRKQACFTEGDLKNSVMTFIEHLADAVDVMRASVTYQRWLTMIAAFRSYSFANVILILTHCPTATRVTGYRTLGIPAIGWRLLPILTFPGAPVIYQ